MLDIHQLHTLSGIIIVSAFGMKVGLHVYLDQEINIAKTWQSILFFPLTYMGPYRTEVRLEQERLKKLCNGFYYTTIIALVVNFIAGLSGLT